MSIWLSSSFNKIYFMGENTENSLSIYFNFIIIFINETIYLNI